MGVTMSVAMMPAMMAPALVALLARYRRDRRRGWALVAAGYLGVWTAWGIVAGLSDALSWAARLSPVAVGIVFALAGGLQLTAWKTRQLARCRVAPAGGPLAYGLRAGVQCALCCAGYMAVLLVAGLMNVTAMAGVTLAITMERLAPRPALVARVAGMMLLGLGAFVIARGVA